LRHVKLALKMHFMVQLFLFLILVTCICMFGCKPRPEHTTLPNEDTKYTEVVQQKVEISAEAEQVIPSPTSKEYSLSLLSGPWEKYLNVPPKILIFNQFSKGIKELLEEEQELIKSVLDANADLAQTSEHSALNDRLDQLKAAVPSTETSSGYVRTRKYYKRTYISDDTIYTNSYPYSSSYSVFYSKQKSSSPDLVRSVTGIVVNASLDDIDQRIDALQHTISTWTRRTSTMSNNGTAGIMRDANEAYIEALKSYTLDFIEIRKALNKIKQKQAQITQNKETILQNWKTFESSRLSVLKNYLENNAIDIIDPMGKHNYALNDAQLKKTLILSCQIGPRVVYFKLAEHHHPDHPFMLVNLTGANTE
jgi:hypothetical protein